MAVVIQHDYAFFAYEKMPVASDAVVEPRLAPEQHAVGERPDSKLVPKAPVAPLESGEVVAPEFHEIPQRHFPGHTEKPRYQRQIEKCIVERAQRSCFKMKCGLRFEMRVEECVDSSLLTKCLCT
jgi:hypothetical protein